MIPLTPFTTPSAPTLLLCLTLLTALAFTITTYAHCRRQHRQEPAQDLESPPADHKSPQSSSSSSSPPLLRSTSPLPLRSTSPLPPPPPPPLPTLSPAPVPLPNYADLPPPLRTTPPPPANGPACTSADLAAAGSPPGQPSSSWQQQHRIYVTKTVQVFPFVAEPDADGDHCEVDGQVGMDVHGRNVSRPVTDAELGRGMGMGMGIGRDWERNAAGEEGGGGGGGGGGAQHVDQHAHRHPHRRHYRKRRTLVFEAVAAGAGPEAPASVLQGSGSRWGNGDDNDDRRDAARHAYHGINNDEDEDDDDREVVVIPEAEMWARMRGVAVDI